MIKYICQSCGAEFVKEYGDGGYIDHVLNFSERFEYMLKHENSESIMRKICYDGNQIRGRFDIELRLDCFVTYCEAHNSEENNIKKCETVALVKAFLEHLQSLQEIKEKIYTLIQDLPYADRDYIGIKNQAFDYMDLTRRNNK